MADNPSKNDITAVFKRLRSIPSNKQCFDCGAKNPSWSSVTYGVFICIDCSAVHRNLGVHLSFVRSTNLDTTYTWIQLRSMQLGGNAAATSFFAQHGISGYQADAQQKYNSRAASLYREKLHNLAAQAMKTHGTKLWIDGTPADSTATADKQDSFDFFDEHTSKAVTTETSDDSLFSHNNNNLEVECNTANRKQDDSSQDPKKTTTSTVKKVGGLGAKRVGLGAKRTGGLGAQKASVNFDELEKEAKLKEELRAQMEAQHKLQVTQTKEQQEKQMASMRLAYQELSVQQKKKEQQFKSMDPKKAEQIERLGMGFGSGHGVSHSAVSDMTVIDQDEPAGDRDSKKKSFYEKDVDFEILSGSFKIGSSYGGPPKFSDSPFTKTSKRDDWGSNSNDWSVEKKSEWSSTAGDNWLDEFVEKNHSKKSAQSSKSLSSATSNYGSGASARVPKSATMSSISSSKTESDEAVKKFSNAKSISSEQFFGGDRSNDYETRANLQRFEGSNSISSSDYFGDGSGMGSSSNSLSSHAPNLYEIKEGLRDGASKVATRLSSLASGVMSSLQDM